MFYFTLNKDSTIYSTNRFGKLNNLLDIIKRDRERLLDYTEETNAVLQNQHPIVKFLTLFSIDPDWDESYLYQIVDSFTNRYTSQCEITGIYSQGKNHTKVLFPESDHNTLLIVDFGSSGNIEKYKSIDYKTYTPFETLYTTDTKQRWNIHDLNNMSKQVNEGSRYTVVRIDPFGLCFSYYYYLKDRLKNNKIVNLSPHGFLMGYPLSNFYYNHNFVTMFNYLNGNRDLIDITETKYTLTSYKRLLLEFIDEQHSLFSYKSFNNINHFTSQFYQINNETLDTFVYPNRFMSPKFTQLSWTVNYGPFSIIQKYLNYNILIGIEDKRLTSNLKDFFKTKIDNIVRPIKIPLWKNHLNVLLEDTKKLI